MEPSFKSTCKLIGKYTPSGPVAYSEVQRKIFEFQNYQNFLRGINSHPRQYFQLPRQIFFGVGGKRSTDAYHREYPEKLFPLLKTYITAENVDSFETDLKDFIKKFVLSENRLRRALQTGHSGHEEVLYKDCVIQPENDKAFGTYDTQLVYGGTETKSPTINMFDIIEKVEAEKKAENRAAGYRGGSRKSRSKKNRKTRRR
jgi:hypothetical protein